MGEVKQAGRERPASTQLETPQPITLLIYLQRPSRFVPVPQHYPLGLAAIQLQRMHRRPVGVTMDQGGYPMGADRKSTRLNSSHVRISYAVFCLKKKNTKMTLPPGTCIRIRLISRTNSSSVIQ